jgi:death-on-curing protein
MIVYPTLEQVLADCSRMGLRIRDPGLLDSALHRPQSRFGGKDVYPTVPLKAAALLHSLVRNHPLVDGNKRLAWLVTVIFLDLNGWCSVLGNLEAVQFVLRVVVDHDLTLDQIEAELKLIPTAQE